MTISKKPEFPQLEDSSTNIQSRVLYEDNHLLVLNKVAGELVQSDFTGDDTLLDRAKAYIKQKYEKEGNVFLGLAHRLDQPVSGAVIHTRTTKALKRIGKIIHDRQIKKIYWAVVKNPPPEEEATLIHHISRNREKNKSYAFETERSDSKRAELKYRLLGAGDNYYLLEIELITGRHHQIRTQLSITGCPIKGDLKYGAPRPNPDGSIHLHARSLTFEHPVSNEILHITAPVPDDVLWKYFEERFG
jgi:23S rRNA pseudouridine1911/1915/1917 synthase